MTELRSPVKNTVFSMNSPRKAILLMNLGSPDSTSVKDLRTYLTEFLMDERVIDKPRWLRSCW